MASSSTWTSFEMPLREPSPIPSAFDFTRFLASSITFMAHLSEVSVYFNDKRLVKLTKTSGVSKLSSIPLGLKATSPRGIMTVTELHSTRMTSFYPYHHHHSDSDNYWQLFIS